MCVEGEGGRGLWLENVRKSSFLTAGPSGDLLGTWRIYEIYINLWKPKTVNDKVFGNGYLSRFWSGLHRSSLVPGILFQLSTRHIKYLHWALESLSPNNRRIHLNNLASEIGQMER